VTARVKTDTPRVLRGFENRAYPYAIKEKSRNCEVREEETPRGRGVEEVAKLKVH
jgi:hypothetical protein